MASDPNALPIALPPRRRAFLMTVGSTALMPALGLALPRAQTPSLRATGAMPGSDAWIASPTEPSQFASGLRMGWILLSTDC
ncbi:MAG: hypothetical protein RLZ51_2199 [Pseudomonadota bacterium]|jgi:hypothetical protein